MRHLIDSGIMESYAPLVDIKGSYTAQFEHVRKISQKYLLKLTIGSRQFCSTVVVKKSSVVATTIRNLHLHLQLDLSFTYLSFSKKELEYSTYSCSLTSSYQTHDQISVIISSISIVFDFQTS